MAITTYKVLKLNSTVINEIAKKSKMVTFFEYSENIVNYSFYQVLKPFKGINKKLKAG